MKPARFQQLVLAWFDRHGRKDLPWQRDISPYRVWISEIMLQQTQVATVIPYFNRFVERFPAVEVLAKASVDEVLQLWSGLGYYSRARNLHKTAQRIAETGSFPDSLQPLMSLPGIGRSTAGAILSIAFHQSHPILDGNVKRVLSRFEGVSGWPGDAAVASKLWLLSSRYLPAERTANYTQAMMDLGATVCTRSKPDCPSCPLQAGCIAYKNDQVGLFPASRPRSVKPVKQCIMLVLRACDQRILLEKRPPAGIWGGLWSLPEFASAEAALTWCSGQRVHAFDHRLMPARRHTFSHYHLDFRPLLLNCEQAGGQLVMEAGKRVWYKIDDDSTLALAAPIKLLLQEIIQQEQVR